MWDCEVCGCQGIAGTLAFCPQCFTPRNQEIVPAGSSEPNASASTIAAVEDRETPQVPEQSEPTRSNESNEGDWGPSDAKNQ